jgi:signal peptidase II
MNKSVARIALILFVVAINIGCDQSTKYLAAKHLKGAGVVRLAGDYLILKYAENNGAFLSVFSSFPKAVRTVLLIIMPVIALGLLALYMLRFAGLSLPLLLALSSVLGGGISNVMIDRVFNNQYVVDFMNIGIGPVRSGIFNFADLSILFGSIALIVLNGMRRPAPVGVDRGR